MQSSAEIPVAACACNAAQCPVVLAAVLMAPVQTTTITLHLQIKPPATQPRCRHCVRNLQETQHNLVLSGKQLPDLRTANPD
jgi:hypothetical protein